MSSFTVAAKYVTDTVGLILYLENRKSGANAEIIFDSAKNGNTTMYIPAFGCLQTYHIEILPKLSC